MKSQIEVILEQILEDFGYLDCYGINENMMDDSYIKGVEDCEKVVKEYLKRVKTN